MPKSSSRFAAIAILSLSALASFAQQNKSAERLSNARALYYTPTTAGLKSYSCKVNIDWKAFLDSFSPNPIPADNPVFLYLNSTQLSVEDDLHGTGNFIWRDTTAPPQPFADGSAKMRGGMEQMFSAYFQAWNAYMKGDMVPEPDKSVAVTPDGDGIKLQGLADKRQVSEKFDKNMLLTEVHVVDSASDELDSPTFATTSDGLILTNIHMITKQPPTAAPATLDISTTYAKVDSYQLPATVTFDVKNVGKFNFVFSGCQTNKPAQNPKPL